MHNPTLLRSLLVKALVLLLSPPVFAEHTHQVRCKVEFSSEQFWFRQVKGYDMVGLDQSGWLADLGKPLLPAKEIMVALPPGMRADEIKVVESSFVDVPGEFLVLPSQPPVKSGAPTEDEAFVPPKPAAYAASQPYPPDPVRFVRQADFAGQAIAVLELYPVRYLPRQRRLQLCSFITLCLEGSEGYECGDYLPTNISENCSRTLDRLVRGLVQNPASVQLRANPHLEKSELPPGGPFDHVIVTSLDLASHFQNLVDWHTQKGVRDTVITTSWIYSNYAGADSQKIRSFIADANSTWGALYFLLGGEDETIPLAFRYYYSDTASSDQYYSDYDDDWIHEVLVGRVSVNDSAQINSFVSKVLKYERDPPRTGYPLDVLLIGMDLDMATRMELLKESIDSLIPDGFNLTKVYDSHDGNHERLALAALNSGQNLVNHAGHGSTDIMGTGLYWHGWGLELSEVSGLSNHGQASVIVSMGCHQNHMDHQDCIGESFVIDNPDAGAVAFTGNTRSGYAYGGNPYSLSGALDFQWWVGLLQIEACRLGEVLVEAKHRFDTSTPNQEVKRHCEWILNLLGEPEMPIWTAEPDSFQVICSPTTARSASPLLIQVRDATSLAPVDQAAVCLWKRGEVHLTGHTDPAGEISFDPRPVTEGLMWVTVTKHNHLPHEQELWVSGCLRGDANGDGAINVADIVYLVNFLYRHDDPPDPIQAGDASCDGIVDVADIVYLVNYLYRGGDPPGC